MPTSPPSPRSTPSKRGEHTRQRVLAAATELFAAKGFAPVTMRAIGDAVGIDNSSVYRHFASKSELAREVLDRAMAALAAQVGEHAADAPATLEGVIDLGLTAALHLWDRPDTARLILHWVTSAKDAATGFDVSLPVDAPGTPSGDLYRVVVDALDRASSARQIREFAWPEAFVGVVGAVTLRPATYRSFLVSQEPERTDEDARLTWECEVRCLLRGLLAP
ncbi:MAG: TetR/AcrR family transcriptional regulator [bacterium]|nr:TetR/AcrR family transcriptional regulator [bacterium]